MTISHDKLNLTDAPHLFAQLGDVSISICAQDRWTQAEIEVLANTMMPLGGERTWAAFDKSMIGLGTATPNPCNQIVGRRHWFLLEESVAVAWKEYAANKAASSKP